MITMDLVATLLGNASAALSSLARFNSAFAAGKQQDRSGSRGQAARAPLRREDHDRSRGRTARLSGDSTRHGPLSDSLTRRAKSDLMFIFILGFKTALAVHRMPDEIAADRAGDAIKNQGIESRARTPVYDHAARLTDPGKRSVNSSLPHPFSRITRPRASSQRPSNRDALGFRELAQFVAQGLAAPRLLHEGRDKIFRLAEIGREHHGFDGSD